MNPEMVQLTMWALSIATIIGSWSLGVVRLLAKMDEYRRLAELELTQFRVELEQRFAAIDGNLERTINQNAARSEQAINGLAIRVTAIEVRVGQIERILERTEAHNDTR